MQSKSVGQTVTFSKRRDDLENGYATS